MPEGGMPPPWIKPTIDREAFTMTINKTQNGTALTIAVQGRLDTITAPEMEKVLKDSLVGVTDLTLDFSALEYVSSAGLRVLLAAHKTMAGQGTMKLIHVNEVVGEILEVTGFTDILTVE